MPKYKKKTEYYLELLGFVSILLIGIVVLWFVDLYIMIPLYYLLMGMIFG